MATTEDCRADMLTRQWCILAAKIFLKGTAARMAAAAVMAVAVAGALTTTWKTGKVGLISQALALKPIMMRSQGTADFSAHLVHTCSQILLPWRGFSTQGPHASLTSMTCVDRSLSGYHVLRRLIALLAGLLHLTGVQEHPAWLRMLEPLCHP